MSYFSWLETKIDKQKVVTSGDDGAKVENITPEEHVRRCLEIPDALLAGDVRPTLVYFHWPHDATSNGKLSDTLCDKTLVDEMAARWGLLFRCVQIDMAKSDKRLLEILEAGKEPSFVIVDANAKVISHIPALSTAMKFAKALEEAVARLPDVAKLVKDTLAAQEKSMAEAKALLKADKDRDALAKIDEVRFSSVRVGPFFDKAQHDGYELAARLEKRAEKDAK